MSYALQDVTSDRTVTVAGTDKLQSRFNSHTYAGRVEGGYRLDMSYIAVTPYTALQFQYTQAPSYAETSVSGSNAFALSFAANASTSTRTELGSWVCLCPLKLRHYCSSSGSIFDGSERAFGRRVFENFASD